MKEKIQNYRSENKDVLGEIFQRQKGEIDCDECLAELHCSLEDSSADKNDSFRVSRQENNSTIKNCLFE